MKCYTKKENIDIINEENSMYEFVNGNFVINVVSHILPSGCAYVDFYGRQQSNKDIKLMIDLDKQKPICGEIPAIAINENGVKYWIIVQARYLRRL